MSAQSSTSNPFTFPETSSTLLPDPTPYFSSHLCSYPLPTNSFFQNFVLKNGDQPEYIHPYLIKSSNSSISISYPSLISNHSHLYQVFTPDLTISALNRVSTHIVSSFSHLSVTLHFPSTNLRFFLVRGSPYLTCSVTDKLSLSISTMHKVLNFTCMNNIRTKYKIKLSNNQTWVLYSDSPISLKCKDSKIISDGFTGIVRLALLPGSNPKFEDILDRYSSCYPLYGDAVLGKPWSVEYKWEKKGEGDLLILAHKLHLKLLSKNECSVDVLNDFKYKSIDGDLVGVVGDSWLLRSDPVSVSWFSVKGVKKEYHSEIVNALRKDVANLDSGKIKTSESYFYGKLIARAARLALIADEINCNDVISSICSFLNKTIEPWLNGTFSGNGLLYEKKWGGLVTKQGSKNSKADFGFGVYNDHHYQMGYFLYAISVLAKIDKSLGVKYKNQAYSLMADFMNFSKGVDSKYTLFRNFDFWMLQSWAGGLTEFWDGRNQESTSEAVNAYYSAALMGLAYEDTQLSTVASTLLAMEIHSAKTWWHVCEDDKMYGAEFTRMNRVVGVLWANKRDSSLWFAPPDWRECRVGIQVLPILPITEVLFSEVGFVKQLVKWVSPALATENWKGFAYALQGIYDKPKALNKIRQLKCFDDGNSLTNMLWWIHSRG